MLEFEHLIQKVTQAVNQGTQAEIEKLTKEFNTPFQVLVATGWVNSNCSDIIFINYTPLNTANGSVLVNNYELQPGGFVGFMGNNAEINRDQYNCVFQSAATKLWVIKKLYVNK